MDKDNVLTVESRKYFALLFYNAAQEFLNSAKADLASKRYLTVLASQRRFLEYSRRAVWLSYFATEEQVINVQKNPDAKNPKPFPELQEIDVLMRKLVGMNGASGLGIYVNDEGTTFMQLLHQFTHGGTRSIQALSAGFKVDGISKVVEQNTNDLRSVACYVLACCLDWPKDAFRDRLLNVHNELEQKQFLSDLYRSFRRVAPDTFIWAQE